ncbi:hypothetical protein GCM10010451_30660 [Streptomyces virens]|uniref:Uncharacterized protein n=1 Tax=Streptomyces virens TaxID=285572 RepID=A0ABP6PI53_9ACTN
MSNIGGNYFRLGPLTESRALSRARTKEFTVFHRRVENGSMSGKPREGYRGGGFTASRAGGRRRGSVRVPPRAWRRLWHGVSGGSGVG